MAKQRISAKRARALINYYLKNKAIIYYTTVDSCLFYDLKKKKVSPITENEYSFITHHTHQWSVFTAVFGKHKTSSFTDFILKGESHHFKSPYYQKDLIEYLNKEHSKIIKTMNVNHLIGVGWIAIPLGLELSESEAFDIFNSLGAFNLEPGNVDTESIYVNEM